MRQQIFKKGDIVDPNLFRSTLWTEYKNENFSNVMVVHRNSYLILSMESISNVLFSENEIPESELPRRFLNNFL